VVLVRGFRLPLVVGYFYANSYSQFGPSLLLPLPLGQLLSADAVYVWPNVQPQCDQMSGKPLGGSCEPKKSGCLILPNSSGSVLCDHIMEYLDTL